MNQSAQANALASIVSMVAQHAARVQGQRHAEAMSQVQATLIKDMTAAVVTRRVDAVEKQCHTVLMMYADQARDYLAEKKSFADKIIETKDAVTRLELRSRLTEIDTNLAHIRADAKLVYDRMGELILTIGGSGLNLSPTLSMPLALIDA